MEIVEFLITLHFLLIYITLPIHICTLAQIYILQELPNSIRGLLVVVDLIRSLHAQIA